MNRYVVSNRRYMAVRIDGHPFPMSKNFVLEHRVVAERALGKYIDPKHPIHHVNGDGLDNRPHNLVVCEDQAYHSLLHRRQRALEACGNAAWLPCCHCKQYSPPEEIRDRCIARLASFEHRHCSTKAVRLARLRRRAREAAAK